MTDEEFRLPPRRLVNGTVVPQRYFADEKRVQEFLSADVYEDDIWVVTYPKSGTTWMQALVALVCLNPDELSNHNESLIKNFRTIDRVDTFHLIQNAPRPRQVKSHLPYDLLPEGVRGPHPPKIIYVTRNSKDVCVSLFHFMKDIQNPDFSYRGSFESFCDTFIRGEVPYGSWRKHVESFWNERHRENILIVSYEEMKQDLSRVVDRVVTFLDKPPLNEEQMNLIIEKLHFDNMKKDTFFSLPAEQYGVNMGQGKFMRKGIVGDWLNFLTPEMAEKLDKQFLNPMKELGLTFEI